MNHGNLDMDRCPWCKTAKPTLKATTMYDEKTTNYIVILESGLFGWSVHICTSCHHLVLAQHNIIKRSGQPLLYTKNEVFPAGDVNLDDNIPERIEALLKQAHDTIHSADACLMVCASALDTMLQERAKELTKESTKNRTDATAEQQLVTDELDAALQEKVKKLKKGSLKSRIDAAAEQHLITEDMKKWAHQVRLEANDSRHPEEDKALATQEEAEQCLEFTMALVEILFVLPYRVTRGIEQSAQQEQEQGTE